MDRDRVRAQQSSSDLDSFYGNRRDPGTNKSAVSLRRGAGYVGSPFSGLVDDLINNRADALFFDAKDLDTVGESN